MLGSIHSLVDIGPPAGEAGRDDRLAVSGGSGFDLNAALSLAHLAATAAASACGEPRSGAQRKPCVKRGCVKQQILSKDRFFHLPRYGMCCMPSNLLYGEPLQELRSDFNGRQKWHSQQLK
jgi:hypothetical protein